MHTNQLIQFFEHHRERGQPLALVTVFDTTGSTYSKAGARMLINGDGIFRGMLSGGCLEGDLAVRAAVVIESREPQVVTYDLGLDDELWGLGVGCDGAMHVFVQALDADNDYQPFAAIARILEGDVPATACTVIESESPTIRAGATAIVTGTDIAEFGLEAAAVERIRSRGAPTSGTRDVRFEDGEARVLTAVIEPVPRMLVLGAGLDAEPVVRFASELGWRCTVVDHRPAYIEAGNFERAERTLCRPVAELAGHVDLDAFDRCIVMSHHLESDRQYLRQLADTRIAYIGLLGPPNRRERLIGDLGDAAAKLEGRVHGPAGIDIGGRGPAVIALSIVAEMQQVLGHRDG